MLNVKRSSGSPTPHAQWRPSPAASGWRLIALAAGLAFSPAAHAHLVTTGLGPVYDGIGHFFLSPDDVGAALAVALLAGLRGPASGRLAVIALPLAWLLGGVAGDLAPTPGSSAEIASAVSLLILGILVASDLALPLAALTAIAALAGAAHGFFNGTALREAGGPTAALQLVGITLTLVVLATVGAALAVSARRPVPRIIIRVSGSWIAATGLLLLGWTLHTRR